MPLRCVPIAGTDCTSTVSAIPPPPPLAKNRQTAPPSESSTASTVITAEAEAEAAAKARFVNQSVAAFHTAPTMRDRIRNNTAVLESTDPRTSPSTSDSHQQHRHQVQVSVSLWIRSLPPTHSHTHSLTLTDIVILSSLGVGAVVFSPSVELCRLTAFAAISREAIRLGETAMG